MEHYEYQIVREQNAVSLFITNTLTNNRMRIITLLTYSDEVNDIEQVKNFINKYYIPKFQQYFNK